MNGKSTISASTTLSGFGGAIARKFVPVELNPRLTNPSAIRFFNRSLSATLVIQPTSLASGVLAINHIPASNLAPINPHNRLLLCPDIFILEITAWPT